MKFVCDRCSTRYSISDEKVQGKVLKIRCKTCSHIIVLREQTGASGEIVGAAAAGGGASQVLRGPAPRTEVEMPRVQAPTAGKNPNVEWWVAIAGAKHGPMKHADIERFFHEGRITARSYCWNGALPGWARLKDLPDFAALAASAPDTSELPPPPPPEDEGAEVLDLQKARAERGEKTAPDGIEAPLDPFAAATAASGGSDTNARPGESTRVFIMQAGLHGRKEKHRRYAVAAATAVLAISLGGYGDWVGWWQIPGLHSAISFAASSAGLEQPTKRKLLAAWDDVDADLVQRCTLSPEEDECVQMRKEQAKKQRVATRKKPGARSGGTAGLDLDGAFGQGGAVDTQLGRATGAGDMANVDPFASSKGDSQAIAGLFASDKKRAAMPVGRVEDQIAVSGGTGPDPAAVMKVIGENAEGVKQCVEQGLKLGSAVQGKKKLLVTITPKGLVSGARFTDGPTNASETGECIKKRAMRWKFPAFVGEAVDVEIPFILSAG
jgi:predicted Zn finger-like uncharacterized protein